MTTQEVAKVLDLTKATEEELLDWVIGADPKHQVERKHQMVQELDRRKARRASAPKPTTVRIGLAQAGRTEKGGLWFRFPGLKAKGSSGKDYCPTFSLPVNGSPLTEEHFADLWACLERVQRVAMVPAVAETT